MLQSVEVLKNGQCLHGSGVNNLRDGIGSDCLFLFRGLAIYHK